MLFIVPRLPWLVDRGSIVARAAGSGQPLSAAAGLNILAAPPTLR
jgi:hypothetical protein